jgi:hypothetical protein
MTSKPSLLFTRLRLSPSARKVTLLLACQLPNAAGMNFSGTLAAIPPLKYPNVSSCPVPNS